MSQSSRIARRLTLALTGWLLAACSTDRLPTSPVQHPGLAPASATQDVVTDLVGATVSGVGTALPQVLTLERIVPLPLEVSASAAIGASGGKLSLPALGVTLVVPAGAVTKKIEFRITAIPGQTVAYEFEPHGTTFKKPLELQQRLAATTWLPGIPLSGGYFESSSQIDQKKGKAKVSEQFPAILSGGMVILKLWHFSGYLVSMG